jgi:hypothetical protein
MQAILNQMKFQSALNGNSNTYALRGIVTNFNAETWKISVTFYPLTDDSGYTAGTAEIPLASSWVGNGWGLYLAPALDTQVLVLFEDSNYQVPIGALFNFDSNNNPLQGVQSGEAWLVHETGSLIKLTNDGKITINGNTEIDITTPILNITTTGAVNINTQTIATIQATESINLIAPIVNVSNDLSITNDFSANHGETTMIDGVFTAVTLNASNDVTANSVSLHNHVHSGVTGGSDDTGPPT